MCTLTQLAVSSFFKMLKRSCQPYSPTVSAHSFLLFFSPSSILSASTSSVVNLRAKSCRTPPHLTQGGKPPCSSREPHVLLRAWPSREAAPPEKGPSHVPPPLSPRGGPAARLLRGLGPKPKGKRSPPGTTSHTRPPQKESHQATKEIAGPSDPSTATAQKRNSHRKEDAEPRSE